jgi:uncharacterized membrane protein YtjA (UPF0391 family)
MLYYSLVFLLIALVSGALGFGALAGTAAAIARVLFLLCLALFVVALIRGKKPSV